MKNLSFRKILIAAGVALGLSIILLAAVTVLVYFGDFSDRTVTAIITAVSAVSTFLGAFLLTRSISGGGLINGLSLGALYCGILLVLSYFIKGSVAFDFANVTRLLIILLSGALGGVLGINSRE